MSMGAEDYVSIAKAVRAMVLTKRDKRHVAQLLAAHLAVRNKRFDVPTFYMACGTWQREDGMPVHGGRHVPKDMREQT
jgi:hypothetical protein